MTETTWMSEGSVFLLLETEFLKIMQYFMNKINAWAYVAYFYGTHM